MATLAVWGSLLGWSLARVPVPGVNEPHYLTKARRFWDPQWCPGDFFLDSANPHYVFYMTFGWLTDVFSLPVAARIGRGFGLLILAIGWQRFSVALTGYKWTGLLALPFLLMLQSLGNLSGEWLVGGIEAKVPAYGCLFWGLGEFLDRRFFRGAILGGLAVSLHPLVGLWGGIALVMTQLATVWRNSQKTGIHGDNEDHIENGSARPRWIVMGLLCLLFALPGLVPALGIITRQDPRLELIANQLQVADRLAHHLDPMQFHKESYRYWGMQILLWLLLGSFLPRTPRERWWKTFVGSTILLVLAGIVIGWGPRPVTLMPGFEWRLKLLKLYFFRLGDQMVPVALALTLAELCRAGLLQPRSRQCRQGWGIALATSLIGALCIPFSDANPSRLSWRQQRDWKQACEWLKGHSSPGDLVQNIDTGWATRWFTQRPEYVSFKDMPQDTPAIVEWNHRLWVIARWRTAVLEDHEVTEAELKSLRQQTGIRFILCSRFGPMASSPAFENETFRIYAIPESTKRLTFRQDQ